MEEQDKVNSERKPGFLFLCWLVYLLYFTSSLSNGKFYESVLDIMGAAVFDS